MTDETLTGESLEPAEQVEQDATPAPEAESAPAVEAEGEAVAEPQEAQPPETPEWAQERINKITAQKYEEKRAREEAERRAAELEAMLNQQKQEAPLSPPTLDQFDYDEAQFNQAMSRYQQELVQREVQRTLQSQQQEAAKQAELQRIQAMELDFLDKAKAFQERNKDFAQTVSALPQLPDDTYKAILQSEKAPEMAYYLGKHLDVADRLIGMSPVEVGRELYRIESMFQGQKPQASRAPAPPPSVGGGSGATDFDHTDTSIPLDQWMRQMRERDIAKLGTK